MKCTYCDDSRAILVHVDDETKYLCDDCQCQPDALVDCPHCEAKIRVF